MNTVQAASKYLKNCNGNYDAENKVLAFRPPRNSGEEEKDNHNSQGQHS